MFRRRPSLRTINRSRIAAVTVVLLVTIPAATALGATAARVESTLIYTASPGEVNLLEMGGDPLGLVFTDLGASITPGEGCASLSEQSVFCPANPDQQVVVDLGDQDDSFGPCTTSPCSFGPSSHFDVRAGDGNDTIRLAGRGSVLDGGNGDDEITGGDEGDRLIGGPGNDVLDTGGGRPVLGDSIEGGDGDDVMRFQTGTGSVQGGEGMDLIDYSFATNPYRIILGGLSGNILGGRFHTVGTDVENAIGGSAGDSIVGSATANTLEGGAGPDVIDAGEGDDLVLANDGEPDQITCGPGTDVVRGDGLDTVAEDCESVLVPLVIESNTVLTEDQLAPIVIAADSVTLDCAGHSVNGPGVVGIDLDGRRRVTVKNCVVIGFDVGYRLTSTADNTLVSNMAESNGVTGYFLENAHGNLLTKNSAHATSGDGFLLSGASKNRLTDNVSSDNSFWGFGFFNASNNTYLDNRATGNGNDGIGGYASSNNLFQGNVVENNGGDGISLFEDSNDNTVWLNTANGNAVNGFRAFDSHGNLFLSNRAEGSGILGFSLWAATANTLTANISHANNSTGFGIESGSNGNTLTANTATGNQGDGFSINASSANQLAGNQAQENIFYGFRVEAGSSSNRISGNRGCNNGLADAFDDQSGPDNLWRGNRFCVTDGL